MKYSAFTFFLQLLCYNAILRKCKMKSNWVSKSKGNNLFLAFEYLPPWKKKICDSHFYLWFRIKNKFWSPAAFPMMCYLVSGCPYFWCSHETDSNADHATDNGTKGMQHTTQPEVSALYHNIQVPQKLFSAAPLENSLLTHPSCLFWFTLLVWNLSQSWFAFSFPSLQCSGECKVLLAFHLWVRGQGGVICSCLEVCKLPKIPSREIYSNPCRTVESWVI